MILILGSEGAQGKRYQSILRYLEEDFVCIDDKIDCDAAYRKLGLVTGIIIATPTDTHLELIKKYAYLGAPMLVEKPIWKGSLLAVSHPELVSMVCQYRHLVDRNATGTSHYNYFRHGNDGLTWDCTQIIGLANGEVKLSEHSPVWQCTINGKALNIADMDRAYVLEVKEWLEGRGVDFKEAMRIHEKVRLYAEQAH